MNLRDRFVFGEDVGRALAAGRPVVALETTVVTHGLPQPQGLETALAMEADVRENGATPATIGVIDGKVHVGMPRATLEKLAAAKNVVKLNLSNFAAAMARRSAGSTTVAATMFVARHAGIEVFATGGIGGVHREASGTTGPGIEDASADLTALERMPVAVVCAGAKAILDLPRTVERLETLGVPVFGLDTDHFPAFWRRDSGLPLDRRFETVDELAEAVRTHFDLNFGSGVLVGNPIPEADEMPRELYETALAAALAAAEVARVRGRDVTPFLLDQMRQRTGGASLSANVALLRNNARVAARLAAVLATLR